MKKIILIVPLMFCITFCMISKHKPLFTNKQKCDSIDTLIKERYVWKTGNFYANQILPSIIKDSNIDASCQKGTFGYLYRNDSLFDSDIKKWQIYFNCK
jgi:hypothetical protein